MKIDTLRANNKPVESMMWNGLYLYKDPSLVFPDEYIWEYSGETDDFPNTVDNTVYFNFTRNKVHYSSSRQTYEAIYEDSVDDGCIYQMYCNQDGSYSCMYFSINIPAGYTLQIDGLAQGFDYNGNGYGRIYLTKTKPTGCYSAYNDYEKADALIMNVQNKKQQGSWGTGRQLDSSLFTEITGTVTNDTDTMQTYYVVFSLRNTGYYVTNYYQGLQIKYLKFTKV